MEEERRNLHILMLPWLAMGHLLPYLELSKRLASKGIKISFLSTPSNILRLPPIPQTLTPFLTFIPCSPLSVDNLPFDIGNTVDLRSESDRPLLYQAYAAFERVLTDLLSNPSRPKPNWIIYDFTATSWAPSLASRFNVSSALFCPFNAATVSFLSFATDCESPEEVTRVPESFPFATAVNLRPFEARRLHALLGGRRDGAKSEGRQSSSSSSILLLVRTCREFEAKWVDLLGERYAPVPVGFLPPSFDKEEESEAWGRISRWLDEREDGSVVYAAFGSEAQLTREEIDEIGLGLEKSGLGFVWVLRVGLPPEGFEERTAGRGIVWRGWVPQARLLGHPAVGGFLTHGGWGSILESLVVGAGMVVLPMQFEQGLSGRNLVESGYAVEVERNDEDGSFCGEDIGRKLRLVMVEEEGEELRKKAREGKELFGSEKLQEEYLDELVKKLWEEMEMEVQPV